MYLTSISMVCIHKQIRKSVYYFKQQCNEVITCKCDGLSKCDTLMKACSDSKVRAFGSTDKIFLPLTSKVETKSPGHENRGQKCRKLTIIFAPHVSFFHGFM